MRLPGFIIIGAAKSGTTTLYEYLCRHPQIFMCDPKEPEFFARDDVYARGRDWYAALFDNAAPGQVCGEASTIYTCYPKFPEVPRRMREMLPNVRLIYLMREPVSRAYSAFVQEVKNKQRFEGMRDVPWTFEQKLAISSYYTDASDYQMQLEQYLAHFDRQQILAVAFEHFIEDVTGTLAKICDFIGVDDSIDLTRGQAVHTNAASDHAESFARREVIRRVSSIPGVSIAKAVLPHGFKQRVVDQLKTSCVGESIKRGVTPEPMTPQTRRRLKAHFRGKRPDLEALIGEDLSCWK